MSTCSICQRERKDGTRIELTQEERELLKRSLSVVPEAYFYCAPCFKVLQDKAQGAQLFKGLLQSNLTRFGVRGAHTIAERYYRFLVDRATKKSEP